MKTFGIMVTSINISQSSYFMIYQLNQLLSERFDICPIIFYQEYGLFPLRPQFSMLQDIEAWSFDGPLISTNITTSQTMLNCPRTSKRFFYIWDLEWLYTNQTFSFLSNIYQNPNLQLIAKNKKEAEIITQCWKRPVSIIEDFNYQQIVGLL